MKRNKFQLKGLYGITYPYPGIPTLKSIEIMIKKGAKIIQLREKHVSDREYLKLARKALKICKKHGVQLVINDRVGVALILDLPIHVGKDDLDVKEIKDINKKAVVGYSIANFDDLETESAKYADYYGIGPIFYSPLKPSKNYFGLKGLKKLKKMVKKPVVVIGGFNENNIDIVLKLNPDAVGIMFYKFLTMPHLIEKINKFYGV